MNRIASFLFALALGIGPAAANFDVTTGSGTHIFAVDTANLGTSACAGANVECPATVLIDSTGALLGTTGNPIHDIVTNTLTALVNSADSVAPVSSVTSTAGNSPVNSYNFVFDGTNWDRARGTTGGISLFAPQAAAAGGALNAGPYYSAASNNATNVKNAAGTLYSVTVTQSTTTAMELKLYNTSSSPTCSSATSIIDNIPIPSNATSPGYHLTFPVGRVFSTGISFCLVAFGAPAASTDNSNATTGATVSFTYD